MGDLAFCMQDWKIKTRAHACHSCEKAFEDRQVYHTLLFLSREEYSRLDVCESCWRAQYGEGASDRKGFVSHWRGVFHPPPPAPPEPIKKDTAESLLRKVVERGDDRWMAAAYILAVILERKRILKVKDQIRDQDTGRRVFIYEHAATGDLWTIRDPDLEMEALGDVHQVVTRLLTEGLPPEDRAPDHTDKGLAEGTESIATVPEREGS